MRSLLTDLFINAEDGFEALRDMIFDDEDSERTPVLQSYLGYSTPTSLVARGRVLAPRNATQADAARGKLGNVRNVLSLFNTRELSGVRVRIGGVDTESDEEGYVRVELPVDGAWARDGAALAIPFDFPDHSNAHAGEVHIRLGSDTARYGIISDIDDTVMKTEAWSLHRNIVNSLSGAEDTRVVFPDAVQLLKRLTHGGNPLFFVSSSPWNLYGFLSRVFARNDIPPAPKFLRDFGIGEGQLVTGTHGDHKGASIDTIMAAKPDLGFLLIGDTGQHDAHVYADAQARHGTRVRGIILRVAGALDRSDEDAMLRLRDTGTPVWRVADYRQINPGELEAALA